MTTYGGGSIPPKDRFVGRMPPAWTPTPPTPAQRADYRRQRMAKLTTEVERREQQKADALAEGDAFGAAAHDAAIGAIREHLPLIQAQAEAYDRLADQEGQQTAEPVPPSRGVFTIPT